ncbi:MAG TPA: ELWxxDGT repeat protein [Parafilimonas sp.]|nr:ELWxxDGT repeat protein [Parafilimonas sp.]
MKTRHLLPAVVMLFTTLIAVAQDATNQHLSAKDEIPFGKQLPPPDLVNSPDRSLRQATHANTNNVFRHDMIVQNANKKTPEYYKQLLLEKRKTQSSVLTENVSAAIKSENKNSANSNFHLVKDINALTESNPRNFTSIRYDLYDNAYNDSVSFAVLDNVIYFVANDAIHGNELWRSDGTGAGTYMLKDIEPGAASSLLFNITAVNGKIYFTGFSSVYGTGAWISDGTESGTQLLIDVYGSANFFAMNNKVCFIADGFDVWSAVWETDGTTAGTKQVIELGDKGFGGSQIMQPTVVDGLLFFTFLDYETLGWQIWRSDLTDAGTYHIGPSYPLLDSTFSYFVDYTPAQLTNYKNKLYYSANVGTGRKLWVSDGTDAGTKLAPGNHNIIINADFLETSFPIMNNTLYIPGEQTKKGHGLYKYESSAEGLVKVKDLAAAGDTAFIVPEEMHVANNTLYFKVVSYNGGMHDELWSSKGTKASSQVVYKLQPGETIQDLYDGNGTLYFVKSGQFFGSELWKVLETLFGPFPIIQSDIFEGVTGSHPGYLTAFKGNIVFSATGKQKGTELFITNSAGFGAKLVKDINTVATSSSLAGFSSYNFYGYGGMAALGNELLFNAYERIHGMELYKSNGKNAETILLNDIMPGEEGDNRFGFVTKNKAVYFIARDRIGSSYQYTLYRTDGTKQGLSKIATANSFIYSFNITQKGLAFYVVYNSDALVYELWRSDGTTAGTFLLSSTVYYRDYLNVTGNTAFFVAGDAVHGYELWKSDGSSAGTVMVKDINPGVANSTPGGMYIYKNEVYFSAFDGTGAYPSFWKSNGKGSGTIKLKDIEPWWGNTTLTTARYFCISNDILYFSAINHSNDKGTVFWRTDGTPAGTQSIKDINPTDGTAALGPSLLTDVNGTIFFTANDGVHGRELWKSDGTQKGTKLVEDLTPGISASNINGLTNFAGKLYFQNAEVKEDGVGRYYLWSSDGTPKGTKEVEGFGISHIAAIFPGKNKLFLDVYTNEYGNELYAGKAEETGTFVASKVANEDATKTSLSFNAVVYPNPVVSSSTLQITGNTKNVSISIADMSGKKIWQSNNINAMNIKLPTEKYAAGVYVLTVTNGKDSKIIKLVKQ